MTNFAHEADPFENDDDRALGPYTESWRLDDIEFDDEDDELNAFDPLDEWPSGGSPSVLGSVD